MIWTRHQDIGGASGQIFFALVEPYPASDLDSSGFLIMFSIKYELVRVM